MKSILSLNLYCFFVAARICEIGGGYLIWLWLRNRKGFILGIVGSLGLFLYPTKTSSANCLAIIVGIAP